MGREAFLEEVWRWKEESGGTIVNQLKRLGASCDWSRERFTMDEGLSQAVLKVFVGLHKQGLIYRAKRLVNWDPKFQTAISDLEVVQVEKSGSFKWQRGGEDAFDSAKLDKVLSKDPSGHLYYFNYPLEGVTYDADDASTFITVATTRPETMLGDTGVAVHPENETLGQLIGKNAILPLVGRIIPIFGDDYADPEKGTGAVKITPAHDFNDFEVGKRHKLDVVNILDGEARMLLADNADFLAGATPDGETLALHGLDRFAARKRVVAMMEARGFLAKVEPHGHTVPHGDRSDVVIEPWLTDQWYVDVKPLAQRSLKAVKRRPHQVHAGELDQGLLRLAGEHRALVRLAPALVGPSDPGLVRPGRRGFVAESEAAAQALALGHYGGPVALTRDEDVLDTWFSSALWPFSTLGWPDETPSSSATTRLRRSSPPSTSSSSGSPG
jgi:valyl-tRNA synthetase